MLFVFKMLPNTKLSQSQEQQAHSSSFVEDLQEVAPRKLLA